MKTNDFWFDLPKEQIAQTPASPRDAAKLMCLNRSNDEIKHSIFRDLTDILKPGDLLVINNSKVIPARLIGTKVPTGAACEILMLRQQENDIWECLARPGKRLKEGTQIEFGDGTLSATIIKTEEDGNKLVQFRYDTQTIFEKLDEFGKMPLPPYITEQLQDQSQYQTVYAKHIGSAAAPTAGLHFTPELLEAIKAKGVQIAEITLHVGLGTFRPVKEDEIENHLMHSEQFTINRTAADLINTAKKEGRRVIAVGTTSCRTLEAASNSEGLVQPCTMDTEIFIYPGYRFKCMDALITNFHLPESTLIMLVSAFYGREKTLKAYREAVKLGYRFFSFGDAMLIE